MKRERVKGKREKIHFFPKNFFCVHDKKLPPVNPFSLSFPHQNIASLRKFINEMA